MPGNHGLSLRFTAKLRLGFWGRSLSAKPTFFPAFTGVVEMRPATIIRILLYALTYQNLQRSRVPINSILGFIIRTYNKVGFGRLR